MSNLNRMLKISIFTLGLAVFGLAPAAQAVAGQGHNKHHYKKHYNNHNYNRRHNRHGYNRHHNRHNYNRYSYNSHYYGGGHYNRHNNHHRRGHGGEVALGLITGGLLFYALTANQRKTETVYVQQQPVYVQPTQQQWVQQRPAQPVNNSCLQVREYQTTITVGGQTVPAYGQSCLQADGSWKLGPAIPEPSF